MSNLKYLYGSLNVKQFTYGTINKQSQFKKDQNFRSKESLNKM